MHTIQTSERDAMDLKECVAGLVVEDLEEELLSLKCCYQLYFQNKSYLYSIL